MSDSPVVYAPGDILFYTSTPGNIEDAVIAEWTANRFVHVAIAISPEQKIEALNSGIVLSPINNRLVAAHWSYMQHAAPLVEENLLHALEWLHSEVGQAYGFGDILDAFLLKFEHVVTLDINNNFDCAALAGLFLLKAGGIAALQNVTDAHQLTPASLATLLGVA